jgi:hypothetical protein
MSNPAAQPNSDVSHDLGKLLKQKPGLFRVLQIYSARMTDSLQLELDASLGSIDPAWERFQYVTIKCFKAVDYSIRPKPPEMIEGGKFVEYFEKHPRLLTVSQSVPHSDDMEQFNPPIQFKMLALEDTWVIAERFQLRLLRG